MSQLKIKNGNNWESIPAGGIGVPSGGNSGQYLKKSSSTDYATEWADLPSFIKSKKFTGTTSATGTLVIDITGINKVLAARARTPNEQQTGWRFVCWIRGDEYPQIVDTTSNPGTVSVQASKYVEVEVFYI